MMALVPELALRAALPKPRLHWTLRSRNVLKDRHEPAPLGLAGPAVLLALALLLAQMAEHTTALISLAAIALLSGTALVWGWSRGHLRWPRRVPRRPARLRADRRPFLLRTVMILGTGRPNRIVGRAAPRRIDVRLKPVARAPSVRQIAPRRRPRLISRRILS